MRTAALVANKGARQTDGEFVKARQMLLARGVRLTSTQVVAGPEQLGRALRSLLADRPEVVIVAAAATAR